MTISEAKKTWNHVQGVQGQFDSSLYYFTTRCLLQSVTTLDTLDMTVGNEKDGWPLEGLGLAEKRQLRQEYLANL